MAIYAAYAVQHLWLIDPAARMLEAYRLEGKRWTLLGTHADNDEVSLEPFSDMKLKLSDLLGEASRSVRGST